MAVTRIMVSLIRKGEVAPNLPATLAATEGGYLLAGLPTGLLDDGEVLALVAHLVENEAGYLPPDEDGEG